MPRARHGIFRLLFMKNARAFHVKVPLLFSIKAVDDKRAAKINLTCHGHTSGRRFRHFLLPARRCRQLHSAPHAGRLLIRIGRISSYARVAEARPPHAFEPAKHAISI